MHERSVGLVATEDRADGQSVLTRRECLSTAAMTLFAGWASSLQAQPAKKSALSADEERTVAGIRERAQKIGLGTFEVRWTEHFLGVGDAPPEDYIGPALGICEAFAKEFLSHFRERGFKLEFPPRRMTVVALEDDASYSGYSGAARNAAVGGHYDIGTNELVVFDFRPNQAALAAGAKRVNTFTLVHETAHMLCYNTGLLAPARDIPVAISEGLATYAELWAPPRDRTAIGRVNHPRLVALDQPGVEWIPIARLLSDDDLLDNAKTADLAYAESWLLVHYLLRQPDSLPRLRTYLAGVPQAGGKVSRDAYAESALGSLRDLDASIRRYARRVRSRPK